MTQTQQPNDAYNASHMSVLEGLEAVRKRPGMYIGPTDIHGLHHMIREVVDNSVDEAMAGYADAIRITIHPDCSVTIWDNGRGIPVDIHPKEQISGLELATTKLHGGGKFNQGGYKVSSGLHGVGLSVVNALSEWMRAEVRRGGTLWQQTYTTGRPDGEVKPIGTAEDTGTQITFLPDTRIFRNDLPNGIDYRFATLAQRFREMAYLTKGLRFKFVDERDQRETNFYFEGGIVSYVRHLNRDRQVLHRKPFYVERTTDGVMVEVAMQYTSSYDSDSIYAFANNINNMDGGSHLTGFRTALTRIVNSYARSKNLLKDNEANLTGDDVREGLTAVISVKLEDPQFSSQTKEKLVSPEASSAVATVMGDALAHWLDENPSDARRIIEKTIAAARTRLAVQKVRETARKSAMDGFALPGKLADCSDTNPERCELYIVEGDSAGGSAKQGRDRRFQAILPLRGKILNVEKSRLDKMLSNTEVKALITAIGAAVGDQFTHEKLRYHRILLMTDADVDGSHIRTLLLTFFFRHMRPLIAEGHLYIAQPPLYRISHGKTHRYVYSDAEKEAYIAELAENTKVDLQRYKGLGEMNPEQLWTTTMNPENRVVLQVTIEDAQRADETFTMLMGDMVAPRKKFIQTHATQVENLDV